MFFVEVFFERKVKAYSIFGNCIHQIIFKTHNNYKFFLIEYFIIKKNKILNLFKVFFQFIFRLKRQKLTRVFPK